MKIREGTYDKEILKEIERTYGWLDVEGRVVMDIGACFGGASHLFLSDGAKQVISYEPDHDNFLLLQENLKGFKNSLCVNSAITTYNGTTSFFLNVQGTNKGSHTIRPTRGRTEVTVPTLAFKEQLEVYKPAVLKIDCEGSEYSFLTDPLPDYVKEVCIELHLTNEDYRQKAVELVKLFEGWHCEKSPRIGGKNWHTIGGWWRI